MIIFNSIQIVIAFAAWPFLIAWLSTAEFRGSTPAFYAACAAYVVAFACMVASVADSLSDGRRR